MIGYLAALAPIIFGTTYLLTSDFLPPGRPLLAVTPKTATDRTTLAGACGATTIGRADLRSGYAPAEQLGRCERWVSTAKASHVIRSAEASRSP